MVRRMFEPTPIPSVPAASSPAATGPAGPFFEGQVGAHYLLSMLAGGEPRGLLGTKITRSESHRLALCFSKTHLFDATGGFRRVLKGEGSRVGESEAKAVPFSLLRLMR